jgi:peroxiredoxin
MRVFSNKILGAALAAAFTSILTLNLTAQTGPTDVGKPAPDFSAIGSDNKTYTLKSLTQNEVLVLYFIKNGCPVNNQAMPHFKNLGEHYKDSDKVNFIGVFNGDARAFEAWNRQFEVPFTVLLDSSREIINAFGATRSPWVVKIGSDGNIAKVMPGYSQTSLESLHAMMTRDAGKDLAKIDFSGAPDQTRFG